MRLVRCREQRAQTLDELYEELAASADRSVQARGKAMLELLGGLRAWPGDTRAAWGVTIEHRLCLRTEDRKDAPWFVAIEMRGADYAIEYRLPAAQAPWAMVRGDAHTVADAVDMVRSAMVRSAAGPADHRVIPAAVIQRSSSSRSSGSCGTARSVVSAATASSTPFARSRRGLDERARVEADRATRRIESAASRLPARVLHVGERGGGIVRANAIRASVRSSSAVG